MDYDLTLIWFPVGSLPAEFWTSWRQALDFLVDTREEGVAEVQAAENEYVGQFFKICVFVKLLVCSCEQFLALNLLFIIPLSLFSTSNIYLKFHFKYICPS